ncbi:hypothetical protein GGR56DRAFT_686669 [Xylariaceae sp. FL0804]|nr:hypothetical protein GGR56DRAFT_686669 [Xylariaceae sp. FL0804]
MADPGKVPHKYNTRANPNPREAPPQSNTVAAAVSHKTPPKYNPFAPASESLSLDNNRYKPRDLLNYTVKAWHGRQDADLSDRQREAKQEIIDLVQRQDQAVYEQIDDDPEKDGGKEEALATAQRSVQTFAASLDRYFFFGCVQKVTMLETTTTGERDSGLDVPNKKSSTGTGIRGSSSSDANATDSSETEDEDVQIQTTAKIVIRVVQSSDGRRPRDALAVLADVARETVRAWLVQYSCRCGACDRAALSTVGLPGSYNGPVFLMLHRLVVSELRGWGSRPLLLEGLEGRDCPGEEVSRRARAQAQKDVESLSLSLSSEQAHRRDRANRKYYSKERTPAQTRRDLIRMTAQGRVLVDPRLKRRQLDEEDAARLKASRAGEYGGDKKRYERIITEEEEEKVKKKAQGC